MTRRLPPELDGEAGWKDERVPCNLDPDKADEHVCDRCPSDIRSGCALAAPRSKRVKPYHDCPTCPYCGSRAGVGAAAYGQTDPKTLKCLCCGEYFQGTEDQVAQARRADEAWERRENNERGPRSVVLRRRSRRENGQLSLAWTDQVVAEQEDSGDDR